MPRHDGDMGLIRCCHTVSWNSVQVDIQIPSQQKIWDPQGPHMGFYMGPIWAPHMGLGWDLQHGSMWYPHGQTHMGHKWEPYGSYSGFGPSGPCPANLCRIDF